MSVVSKVAIKYARLSYRIISVFSCVDLWKFPLKNMGNGISEALKIKMFWGSMPPDPPSASRLRRSFSLRFLCVPRRKNHATPLLSVDCRLGIEDQYRDRKKWSLVESDNPTPRPTLRWRLFSTLSFSPTQARKGPVTSLNGKADRFQHLKAHQ